MSHSDESSRVGTKLPLPLYADVRLHIPMPYHYDVGIVLWDSSNENEGDPQFFYDTVLTSVAEADDSRPLWPASPSSGFATGVHTRSGLPNGNKLTGRFTDTLDTHMPYNYCDGSYSTSRTMNASTFFKSEFGQVALPAFETLAAALDGSKGDFGINSEILLHRKHAGVQLQKPILGLFGTNLTGFGRRPFLCCVLFSNSRTLLGGTPPVSIHGVVDSRTRIVLLSRGGTLLRIYFIWC